MELDGVGEPGESVSFLAAASFYDGQQAFDEATARCRLRAERELPPNDRVTQRLFGGIVRWLNAGDIDEGPQRVLVLDEFFAEAVRLRVEVTAQQQRVDLGADRFHAASEGAMRESAVTDVLPEVKHLFCGPHEVVAEPFADGARAVAESLEVAFEMGPAPLQATHAAWSQAPIHAGAVAADDAVVSLAEEVFEDVGGAAGAAGEERERRGHDSPDPGFGVAFLGRRFVDVRRRLLRKLGGEFVISGLDGFGNMVLQLDQPTGARGLIQNHAHELSGPPLRLAKTGHEHAGKGDEPWPGLAGGHARR